MSKTHKQILDFASSASDMAVAAANLRDTDDNGLGNMIAEVFTPNWKTRTGLSSSATHAEEFPGAITNVLTEAGTTALSVVSGTPGAGEVQVTYSSGVPTLVFGDGANTGYQVLKFEAPAGLAAKLAALFR
jgi:hypothetical protein